MIIVENATNGSKDLCKEIEKLMISARTKFMVEVCKEMKSIGDLHPH